MKLFTSVGRGLSLLLLVAKRDFSIVLDTDLNLFLNAYLCASGDFSAPGWGCVVIEIELVGNKAMAGHEIE